jgi:putative hydrolase of the HAD superfamily
MSRLAEELSRDYPLYVLSNTSCIHVEYFTVQYPVFQLFRQSIYSHLAGAMKPDDHIYHVAIRDLDIKPEETFYIDDLQPNIAAGSRFGFVSHQYDWREHDALLQDLRAAGVTV